MTYTKIQFLEDVAKEARALKEHATAEELARLNFEKFNGNDTKACIYGQMTGDCDSKRASDLIQDCAPIFFEDAHNGFVTKRAFTTYRYSPVEKYLYQDYAKPKNLIAFLKGERKDLVL